MLRLLGCGAAVTIMPRAGFPAVEKEVGEKEGAVLEEGLLKMKVDVNRDVIMGDGGAETSSGLQDICNAFKFTFSITACGPPVRWADGVCDAC